MHVLDCPVIRLDFSFNVQELLRQLVCNGVCSVIILYYGVHNFSMILCMFMWLPDWTIVYILVFDLY